MRLAIMLVPYCQPLGPKYPSLNQKTSLTRPRCQVPDQQATVDMQIQGSGVVKPSKKTYTNFFLEGVFTITLQTFAAETVTFTIVDTASQLSSSPLHVEHVAGKHPLSVVVRTQHEYLQPGL